MLFLSIYDQEIKVRSCVGVTGRTTWYSQSSDDLATIFFTEKIQLSMHIYLFSALHKEAAE